PPRILGDAPLSDVLELGHPIGLGLAGLLFVLAVIIGMHVVGPFGAGAHSDWSRSAPMTKRTADLSNRSPHTTSIKRRRLGR
ncbi:MAG: hypothetical protein ACRD0W_14565, partial [Acidimicrobiales bacterium]